MDDGLTTKIGSSRSGFTSYDPVANSWSATTTTNAPEARYYHLAVANDSNQVLIWGGYKSNDGSYLSSGAIYDFAGNSWTNISGTNAPSARQRPTGVWTGSKMLVWGLGNTTGELKTGAIYTQSSDSWTTMSNPNIAGRQRNSAVWTGSKMIVFGGWANPGSVYNTGSAYNPSTDSWTDLSTTNAPTARYAHTAVWTGSKMIIWGGNGAFPGNSANRTNTAGLYDPSSDTWTATSTSGTLTAREEAHAVWTGSKMVVWGGYSNTYWENDGAVYDPSNDTWSSITSTNAPAVRQNGGMVWANGVVVVWGGYNSNALSTGSRYMP